MTDRNPFWDLIVTYEGTDYPLDLNLLTKREEIALAKKTGLNRAAFMQAWFADDPEAGLAGAWLALRRALGDDAPDLDEIDLPSFGDWVRLVDEAAATAYAAASVEDDTPADPTEPATDD